MRRQRHPEFPRPSRPDELNHFDNPRHARSSEANPSCRSMPAVYNRNMLEPNTMHEPKLSNAVPASRALRRTRHWILPILLVSGMGLPISAQQDNPASTHNADPAVTGEKTSASTTGIPTAANNSESASDAPNAAGSNGAAAPIVDTAEASPIAALPAPTGETEVAAVQAEILAARENLPASEPPA